VTCKMAYHASAWLVLFQIFSAEIILCLRTWAIWNTNKVVGIVLASALLALFIVQCIVTDRFNRSLKFAPSPYSEFRGCFITGASDRVLWVEFVTLFLLQLLFFTLVSISAFRSYRTGRHSELSYIIHRDGILSYVYILVFSGANLVTTILVAAPAFGSIPIPSDLLAALHSVLTTRIVLNIRMTAIQGKSTELHSSYFAVCTNDAPLQFASPGLTSSGSHSNR